MEKEQWGPHSECKHTYVCVSACVTYKLSKYSYLQETQTHNGNLEKIAKKR